MPQVTIQEVIVEEVKKGRNAYQVANVTYMTGRGESKTKKVMSFSNPAVFAVAKGAQAGEVYDVAFVPGDEYYNWASMKPMNGEAPAAKAAAAGSAPKATTSTYETADERKIKQLYIVRQSSITNAIARAGQHPDPNAVDVLDLAQMYVDFVYGNNETLAEMDSDI